jgi:hypothetical protein
MKEMNDEIYKSPFNKKKYAEELPIANLNIYNRALSASEILQNYNAQKSRFNL